MNRQKTPSQKKQAVFIDPIDRILDAVDLNWAILKAPIAFTPVGAEAAHPTEIGDQSVLYRSDNNQKLAIVSSGHRPWQPREVIDFYFGLSAFYGLAFESVGYVQGGRKLWSLLNTGYRATLSRTCSATMYLLLSTSCDSPLAAQATAVCMLDPGGLALPAAPGKSTIARIARSFEFLTPADLAEIGELMRECITFPGFLEELSSRTLSYSEMRRATAATFGSRGDDPDTPSGKAFRAVLNSLRQGSTADKRVETTSLDLLYALASVSDARDLKRWPQDFRNATWFGAGFKRKQLAVHALARMLRPYLG